MEMGTTWGPDRLLYRAIAISLALHLVVALFFPALVSVPGDGPSIETISFVRAIHISVLPAHRVAASHAAVAVEHAPVPAVVIPPRKSGQAAVHEKLTRGRESAAPLVGVVQHKGGVAAPIVASAPPSAVSATPVAATVASSQTHSDTGGYVPLGAEEHDPILDPSVAHTLAALGAHTTLTVTVDANGKTMSVAFSPDIDASVEAQIRSLLSQAHWDAAVCGAGIGCDGKATIKL